MGCLSVLGWWLLSVTTTALVLCVGQCPGDKDCPSPPSAAILPFIVGTSIFCHCTYIRRPTIGWALVNRFYQSLTVAILSIVAYIEVWPQITFYSEKVATSFVSFIKTCESHTRLPVFKELAQPSSQFWSTLIMVLLAVAFMYLSLWELLARISTKDFETFRNRMLGPDRKELGFSDEDTLYILSNSCIL
ncbi:hypothetical protein AAG570_011498 [Ranatra chinensis]|uniref:Uncharacterized protein n=1 Tax=Ranatra chinensis TaxID=642074 RepID=A0ABD0YZ01_9HEMI